MLFGKLASGLNRSAVMKVSQKRDSSSVASALYKGVWRKSNVLYITYVAVGCVVLGGFYGTFMSMAWEKSNTGVRFVFLTSLYFSYFQ